MRRHKIVLVFRRPETIFRVDLTGVTLIDERLMSTCPSQNYEDREVLPVIARCPVDWTGG